MKGKKSALLPAALLMISVVHKKSVISIVLSLKYVAISGAEFILRCNMHSGMLPVKNTDSIPIFLDGHRQGGVMKTFYTLTLAGFLIMTFVVGCGKKSYDEGTQAALSIQNVEQELRMGKKQIESTMNAMEAMFAARGDHLKKQFKVYSDSVDDLEKLRKTVTKRLDTMVKKKADYLKQWSEQMQTIENTSIRETSEKRMASVEQMFASVQTEISTIGETFNPFMKKLNDIRTAMNMDLNVNGLQAMRPIADQAQADADTIAAGLDSAVSVLNSAVQAL